MNEWQTQVARHLGRVIQAAILGILAAAVIADYDVLVGDPGRFWFNALKIAILRMGEHLVPRPRGQGVKPAWSASK